MKKLLTLLLVLVSGVGFAAGTTTETSGKSTIQTGPASFTNFVQLGELGTPIKMRFFSGATGAAEGANISFAHGVVAEKIISVTAVIGSTTTDVWYPMARSTAGDESEFQAYFTSSNLVLNLSGTNSGNLLNRDYHVTILYKD